MVATSPFPRAAHLCRPRRETPSPTTTPSLSVHPPQQQPARLYPTPRPGAAVETENPGFPGGTCPPTCFRVPFGWRRGQGRHLVSASSECNTTPLLCVRKGCCKEADRTHIGVYYMYRGNMTWMAHTPKPACICIQAGERDVACK